MAGVTRAAPRRLTARSVLASTLLGVSPPALPTRSLVGTAELLGISPGTARVAISRMVAAGELEATADGYRLASPGLLARQARQDLSRTGIDGTWDGRWRIAVVDAAPRPAPERAGRRAALVALRFAELREGVWLRPDNLPAGTLPGAEAVVADQCLFLDGTPEAGTDSVDLVARLWPLADWSAQAVALIEDLHRLGTRIAADDTDALADGFLTSATTLRHLQADPLLPDSLLAPDWPGADLRTTHRTFDGTFKATLARWQRRHHAP